MFDSTQLSHSWQTKESKSNFFGENSSEFHQQKSNLSSNLSQNFKPSLNTTNLTRTFGKPSNTSNEWKTCSQNFLKKYIPDNKSSDVINLQSQRNEMNIQSRNIRPPIRNLHNIINNEKLPDFYLKNRDLRLSIQNERRNLAKDSKSYDIISGAYKGEPTQINRCEQDKMKTKIVSKYNESHEYDRIFSRFYDQTKEKEHWQAAKSQEKHRWQNHQVKLPPSYINREPLILDRTKPLPESLLVLDKQRQNAKRRYQTKYQRENLYQQRNHQVNVHKQAIARNKNQYTKFLQSKKEFNVITHDSSKIDYSTLSAVNSNGFRA